MNNTTYVFDKSRTILLSERTKWAFTTRRIPEAIVRKIDYNLQLGKSGDLVLAKVTRIGSHKRLQTREGKYSRLYPDDLIVAVCGARFATDQFEGIAELSPESSDLLAGGGVIGKMRSKNNSISNPTCVSVLGRLCDKNGHPVNLDQFTLPRGDSSQPPFVIGVVGSGMNAGKTDMAASLIHGLERVGMRTVGVKLTGTGSFGDVHAYSDAGASEVLDFTDAGMASTYLQPVERILQACDDILTHVARQGYQVAVVELADGVTQVETAKLLNSRKFNSRINSYYLAAGDTLSVFGGISFLSGIGVATMGVGGLVTRSPLAVDELENTLDIPVLSRKHLWDPAAVAALLNRISGDIVKVA